MSLVVFVLGLGTGAAIVFLGVGLGIRVVLRRLFGRSARIPPFQSLLAAALTLSAALICAAVPAAGWLFDYGGCDFGLKQPAVCSDIPDGLGQAAFTLQLLLSPTLLFLVPSALIAIVVIELRGRRKTL